VTHDEALQALASAAGAVVVQPGDILIIGLTKSPGAEAISTIAKTLREEVPDTVRICVIDSVAGIAVVPAHA
jgi:hypothetical protein